MLTNVWCLHARCDSRSKHCADDKPGKSLPQQRTAHRLRWDLSVDFRPPALRRVTSRENENQSTQGAYVLIRRIS